MTAMSAPRDIVIRSRLQSMWQVRLSKFSVLVADCLALTLAAFGALVIAVVASEHDTWKAWLIGQAAERYWVWLGLATAALLLFQARYQHYTDRKPFWSELGEVLENTALLAVIDLALLSLTRWNSSRLWWLSVWVLVALFIPIGRAMLRRGLMRRQWWQRPTVLIGTGPNAHEALLALRSEPQLGFEVIGAVASHGQQTPSSLEALCHEVPRLNTTELERLAQQQAGLQVVLALEHQEAQTREAWLRLFATWRLQDVCVIPALRGIPLFGTDISWFFSHEVALLRLRNNLRRWPARLTKRLFDMFTASFLLVLLSPVMWVLTMRIRADGGQAVFRHERIGKDGKAFPCFKFRTMVVDAEQQLELLLASDPVLREEWERDHKLKNDPRISAVGHFLRRTSLDELPQLVNVIRGEMSLVGPRPIVQDELAKYGDDVDYFLMVRPGITGLWQVSGRNDVDYEQRVYLDTWYVKNWSLWYDIAILFKTVRVVLRRDGAY
jgi:Undecaprenyl-phosphate galactose phosphotransferase WbaP